MTAFCAPQKKISHSYFVVMRQRWARGHRSSRGDPPRVATPTIIGNFLVSLVLAAALGFALLVL